MLPRDFPENAFAAEYALKDLSYALELAREGGIAVAGAELAGARLGEAIRRGDGRRYWPVLLKVVAGEE
jgi:3-hydroxyisobutyrate dehydrogenase